MVLGHTLAVGAGLCGALAATMAKLAMAADSAEETCHIVVLALQPDSAAYTLCSTVLVYLRLACFGLIFLFNAFMWTLFVKSLQRCSSSLEATVTNTGANIAFTAIIGWLLFKETLSLTWWCGASFILVGLILIHHGSPQPTEATSQQDKTVQDKTTQEEATQDKTIQEKDTLRNRTRTKPKARKT